MGFPCLCLVRSHASNWTLGRRNVHAGRGEANIHNFLSFSTKPRPNSFIFHETPIQVFHFHGTEPGTKKLEYWNHRQLSVKFHSTFGLPSVLSSGQSCRSRIAERFLGNGVIWGAFVFLLFVCGGFSGQLEFAALWCWYRLLSLAGTCCPG